MKEGALNANFEKGKWRNADGDYHCSHIRRNFLRADIKERDIRRQIHGA
jgi:hypothetical protein